MPTQIVAAKLFLCQDVPRQGFSADDWYHGVSWRIDVTMLAVIHYYNDPAEKWRRTAMQIGRA